MSATPDSTFTNPEQRIADLERQLAESQAERDAYKVERDEALERETATAEVLGVINSSPGDLAPVFDAMLEKATALCEAAFGTLATYDGQRFAPAAEYGVPIAFATFRSERGAFAPPRGSSLERVVNGANLVHIADATADPDQAAAPLVQLGQCRSLVCVALRKDNRLVGAITAYRQELRPFTDKQIALLGNFAAQAVIAMENARLITETREALEQQTATAEVLGVINASPGNLQPVFDAMLEKAMLLCDAAFGVMHKYNSGSFYPLALHGVPPAYSELLLREPLKFEPDTALGRIEAGEDIISSADAAEDYAQASPLTRTLQEVGGIRSVVFVSLRKDGVLLGVLVAYRQEARAFSAKQIALLQNFAQQAVIAMENARLLTETREALEQQTATAEVLQVINSSPGDLAPVFEAILEKAHILCEAAHGHLTVYDGEMFRTVAMHGVDSLADLLSRPFSLERGSLQEHLLQGDNLIHIPDIANTDLGTVKSARWQMAIEAGFHTVIFIPLRRDNVLLGYITAYRREVRPFTDKQITLLQNFAAQAVIAMENARLLDELRQRTDQVAELNRGLEARVAEQVDELGRVGRLKRFLAPQLAELIVSHGDEKILESHRREIVVVFCDLRGYTAFTETAEPEEVLEFLRQYHGALGPLVSQFEGTLDQFSGDGIMVFFNDPVPCPDPAERAVKIAMAMRDAASMLIADWRERGRELGFGVGIAQGFATLGQIGFTDRSGYTAIGTVCNVAARLCAEAKGGQILLSQRVNVGLKGSVVTDQIGALALKGLTQPVVAYNVPLALSQPALHVIEGGGPQRV